MCGVEVTGDRILEETWSSIQMSLEKPSLSTTLRKQEILSTARTSFQSYIHIMKSLKYRRNKDRCHLCTINHMGCLRNDSTGSY